ncbi:hypothetical protein M408DRAFT_206873 [Serendipita vermifera MAFF 305830]|uniref:Uncharacterized protein n=1 Tax=Serendipita vermifera MAFF 305830 TaxID=933852 RepID=A0A0C3B2J1_SERVB|nr:hypothetical protein M408DRAFT_206873 [Serendipita vermifera MAFF 305830]
MRFTTTTIILALVAFTSSQAFAAALPAHGESVAALQPSGHDRTRKSLETRGIEILEERGRIRVPPKGRKGGGGRGRRGVGSQGI